MPDLPRLTFHHPAVMANDFAATERFYIEGLGAERYRTWSPAPDDAVISLCSYLKVANCFIELFALKEPKALDEGRVVHFCFQTDDCQGSVDAAVRAGASVVLSPVDSKNHPHRYAFIRSPNGEIIEFVQPNGGAA
jgi:catechol 2,3-dioxygenase-like lactoylglutathione lyase family enzyme